MKLKPVNSKLISAVGYDPAGQLLVIRFNSGKTYTYANVSAPTAALVIFDSSVGGAFLRLIKPFSAQFPYTVVDTDFQLDDDPEWMKTLEEYKPKPSEVSLI